MDISLIVILLAVFLVIYAIIQYNRLVRLNVQVDESFSQIEVQLKRRADLIPNLVETVKGYAAHEKEALENVVQARAASTSASTLPAIAAADGALTNALRGLLAVAEAYPDLKASSNFLQLHTAVKTIPTSFFVGLAKVGEREFYEVDDPSARNVPNVKF